MARANRPLKSPKKIMDNMKEVKDLPDKGTDWMDEETLKMWKQGGCAAYIEVLGVLSPENKDVWETYRFDFGEVSRYAIGAIKHLMTRLETAKTVYKTQQKIIETLSQITIE